MVQYVKSVKHRPLWALVLPAVLIVPLYGLAALHPFPLDFAGLYALMGESVARAGYQLPSTVPYYGPGGIPFAYPPLAFYAMAFCTHTLGVPVFTYLRVAPVAFSVASLLPLYLLTYKITGSRLGAVTATVYVDTSVNLYAAHTEAGGSVRALAFVLLLGGLVAAYGVLEQSALGISGATRLVPAALLFALTLMTHLSYAQFFLLSLGVWAVWGHTAVDRRVRLARAGAIALGGMVAASPWWGTVLLRHGIRVFLAVHTAQPGTGVDIAQQLSAWGIALGSHRHTGLPGLLLLIGALSLCLWRREWRLPAWFLLAMLVMGDLRFADTVVGGLLVGRLVGLVGAPVDLPQWAVTLTPVATLVRVLGLVLVVGYPVVTLARWVPRQHPAISADDLVVAQWLQDKTPRDATFLIAAPPSAESMVDEWFPYLARRTPLIAPWGGEWIGRFGYEQEQLDRLDTCLQTQSLRCVEDLVPWGQPPYLIVTQAPSFTTLVQQLRASHRWVRAYIAGNDEVYNPVQSTS